jgi:hypothetical protein
MAAWPKSIFQSWKSDGNPVDKTESKHDRFLDVDREPRRMLQPIEGYQNLPLVPLDKAVESIALYCPDIQRRAYIAKENCQNSRDGLDQNESASIYLYTMEWEPREQCLYYVLNATLRTEDRQKLRHWLLYLKLILTALNKLQPEKQTIWRGVKCDLNQQYEVGKRYIWWSLSSCTASISVLQSDQFLGKQGARTLFNIECQDGKKIQSHSSVHVEDEFLLPPATQIEVVSKLDSGAGLTITHVKQVQAPFPLIESPSTVSMTPTENLSNQNITNYQNEYLEQVIAKKGYLGRQGLTDVDIPYILQHCLIGKIKESFDISFNQITEKGAQYIGKALEANTSLNILDMRQNLISDLGTRWIAEALQNNTVLTTIYLCENQIGDEGAKFLAETLRANATLKELYLQRNQITDIGTKHLAGGLIRNSTLISFDLQTNRITDEGVKHLAKMLEQNQALNNLHLSENLITNVGVLFLLNTLCHNHGLKTLRIDNLDTSDECFKAIENMFKNNYALSQLWLSKKSYSIDEQARFQKIAKLKPQFQIYFLP